MGSSRPAANKEPRRGAAAASRVQSGREGAERSSAAGTRAGRGRRGEPGARGTASSRGAAPVVSLRTLTAPGAAPGKDGGRKAPAGPAQPHVLPTRAPHGGLRAQDVEEDSERLSAAFASVMSFMAQATRECESYYSLVPACRRREHEVKHICRYHGRQAGGEEPEPSLDRKSAASAAPSQAGTCQHRTKKASKDIYIEVSPGIYSITATSEDMEKQTHVVDVSAGQSIDLTFVL
uniref:A-kinase interacting protein 1 n=1 Tax=Gallus gallus TaxID=9031 RepID=A0A8V0ZL76_CHICK